MNQTDLTRMFGLLSDIKADVAVIKSERKIDDKRIDEIDDRLTAVETLAHKFVGAKAILCAISSAIGAVLVVVLEYILSVHMK